MTAGMAPDRLIEAADGDDTGSRHWDRWVRVSRWGATAIGLWAIVLLVLIGEVVPPVLVIGLVFVSFVPFLRPGARRPATVVGVLAFLAIAGNLRPLVDELTHPDSGWAFVPSLFVTLTAFVLVIAGVATFRRSAASPRPLVVGATTVFAIGVAGATLATTSVTSDEPLGGDTVIVATGGMFADERIVVPAGRNGFLLDNEDGIRHTFTIRENGFEIDAPGYSRQRGEVDLEPGVYEVFCNVPGHESMTIELVVEG